MSRTEPPSGNQYEIRFEEHRATVVEVGGALREYSVGDLSMVDGYPEEQWCTGARGQTLAPWPNRLRDGRYSFDGQDYQVPLDEPDKGNAIHGLVRWGNWRLMGRESHCVTLAYLLHAVPGYRFTLQLSNTYRLSSEGLSVETHATNVGTVRCPYASGAHPYLSVGVPLDETTARAPGAVWLPTDARGIPTGRHPVQGTPYDLRNGRSLRDLKIDFAFTDLERDERGRAWVTLSTLDGKRTSSLWLDDHYPYVELFTGDTLADAPYRRTGLGVEPMTCPPNGFATHEDLISLEPGQSFSSSWGILPSIVRDQ